jgi:hypothetical protein
MFLEALGAVVTADAFDRHRREQQHRAWLADERPATRPRGWRLH